MVLGNTCKVSEIVQRWDNRWAPPLQEEQHHESEGKVSNPSPGDATGDAMSSGPATHSKHEVSHPWVKLSVQVEQLCALHCHPVKIIHRIILSTEQHVLMSIC